LEGNFRVDYLLNCPGTYSDLTFFGIKIGYSLLGKRLTKELKSVFSLNTEIYFDFDKALDNSNKNSLDWNP
jgi:hypothetical protein